MGIEKIRKENVEYSIFPGGEIDVRVYSNTGFHTAIIKSSEDIMRLLLTADAMKRKGCPIRDLEIPYFPYARADRVFNGGNPLGVKVMADLINTIGAQKVKVVDPHSNAVKLLVNNCEVYSQASVYRKLIWPNEDFKHDILVCPDMGALKKMSEYSTYFGIGNKVRDHSTGIVTSYEMLRMPCHSNSYLIIDDICDGGATFISLAKAMRHQGAQKIKLFVTHGIFSKGIEVFDGLIDEVYTTNTLTDYSGAIRLVRMK